MTCKAAADGGHRLPVDGERRCVLCKDPLPAFVRKLDPFDRQRSMFAGRGTTPESGRTDRA